ncbi:hypothetical protein D3C85_1752420 [compost metagenome]
MSSFALADEQLERSLREVDAADIGAGGEPDALPSGEQAPSAKTATAPRHPAIARIIFSPLRSSLPHNLSDQNIRISVYAK